MGLLSKEEKSKANKGITMKTKLLLPLLSLILGALPLLAELKYFPKDKDELLKLVKNENIKLDEIDTSKITDMSYLFCEALEDSGYAHIPPQTPEECQSSAVRKDFGGIEKWDTSNVENMEGMFWGNERFNEPIEEWDVSNVKTMRRMFQEATLFNQSINKWNTKNVKTTQWMFRYATSFNQPLNKWDVSKVENMQGMFRYATSFNQPLNSWNVSRVKNMILVFANATSFNQPLDKWNVSSVEDMYGMFENTTSFNQDLSSWDVRNVKDMSKMFNGASAWDYSVRKMWNLEGKKIKGLIGGTALYKRLYGDK